MEWVLFVHVMLGTIWLGGVIYQEALVAAARREGDEAYVQTAVRAGLTNARLYPPVTMLLLGTAIWMIAVGSHLDWLDGWILAAFGLWLVGVVLGIVYFTPQAKSFAARLQADGPTESLERDVDRMMQVARADTLLLLALLFLMIFKPF